MIFQRTAIAVLALLAICNPVLAAKHHAAGNLHRVVPAAGFSIEVPDGWAACDADTNRQLGNAAHIAPLDKVCTSNQPGLGDRLLVSFNDATPILMFTHHENTFRFPADFFADAPQEVMDGMAKSICREGLGGSEGMQNCALHGVKLAGHLAFEGDATMAKGAGLSVRFFIMSVHSGTMFFMFLSPQESTGPRVVSTEDAVMASLHVPPEPAPYTGSATLTPMPGMSIIVPKGWVACDSANDAALGGAPDPFGMRQEGCRAPSSADPTATNARFVTQDGPNIEFVDVSSETANPAAADKFAAALTDDALARDRARDCGALTATMTNSGDVASDCNTAAGVVAGHPAKVITFSASGTDPDTQIVFHAMARTMVFPANGRLVIVTVCATSFIAPKITDATQAVVDSITMQ